MTWQPIETAPLPKFSPRRYFDERFACLICSDRGVELGVYSFTSLGVGVWSAYGIGPSHRAEPTHWMPLPDPPAQAGEAGTAETVEQGSVHEHAVPQGCAQTAPKGAR